jgi:hypothetical protein
MKNLKSVSGSALTDLPPAKGPPPPFAQKAGWPFDERRFFHAEGETMMSRDTATRIDLYTCVTDLIVRQPEQDVRPSFKS